MWFSAHESRTRGVDAPSERISIYVGRVFWDSLARLGRFAPAAFDTVISRGNGAFVGFRGAHCERVRLAVRFDRANGVYGRCFAQCMCSVCQQHSSRAEVPAYSLMSFGLSPFYYRSRSSHPLVLVPEARGFFFLIFAVYFFRLYG